MLHLGVVGSKGKQPSELLGPSCQEMLDIYMNMIDVYMEEAMFLNSG